MKVLFVASEADGLVKSGGLADVARALPVELIKDNVDVKLLIPCYRPLIAQDYPVVADSVSVQVNMWDKFGCRFRKTELDGLTVYLLEHNVYFDREGMYDDGNQAYEDNGLRYALLCQAAFSLCETLDWFPDVFHCNDWQTALLPFYLREHRQFDARFNQAKTVLTIHNGAYQGYVPKHYLTNMGIHERFFTDAVFESYDQINLMKGGLIFSDHVNAVSPGYKDELLADETSHGLGYFFRSIQDKFSGIINGCDYGQWNPEVDHALPANYSAEDLSGKTTCKTALQQEMGLPINPDIPLLGNISRLVDQKGYNLLIPAMRELLSQQDVQIIVLGSGDPVITADLHSLQHQFPDKFAFYKGYSVDLSHRIEAGSDIYLMPSIFEPCGLNQIYSLRYGTLPVIRKTGGLKDTVKSLALNSSNWKTATGFGFEEQTPEACLKAMKQALKVYLEKPERFKHMQLTAMAKDFSWETAVKPYLKLYKELTD